MQLTVLGSSSSGNCYLLRSNEGEILVLEAGVRFAEVKHALNWQLHSVVGCIISHRHNDHAQYLVDFIKCGIPVLALPDVFEAKHIRNRAFCRETEPKRGSKLGRFSIFSLPVCHDVPCLGFIVSHPEMGKLLFVTDTMMLEYRIDGMNHIMLEANYSDSMLQANIDNGIVPPEMRQRLLNSHMELNTTLDILRVNDLRQTNEIILLHLSSRNSDDNIFAKAASETTGKPVYIARKGLSLDLSLNPY